jgi:subfamily B ATP-binding cassette protein MsbA
MAGSFKEKLRFWRGRAWRQFGRVLSYFRPWAFLVGAAFVFSLIAGGMDGATAYLVKPAMDNIFTQSDKSTALLWLKLIPFAVVGIYFFKGSLRFLQNYILRVIGERVIRRLRDQLYERYQSLSVDYHTDTKTGVMMSRITNDVNMMQRAVPSLTVLFREPVSMIGLAVVAFIMWWKMAILVLVIFAVTVLPIERFGKKIRKYTRRGQERIGGLTSILKENFSGIRVIKAFNMEPQETARFQAENQHVYEANVKMSKYSELSSPVVEALASLAAAFVIFFGGSQVVKGTITSGEFFSFMASFGLMYEPLKKITRMNVDFQSALAAAERVFEVLDTKSTVEDAPDAVELPAVREGIAFEKIHFRYDGTNEDVLRGIDLRVRLGETIAFVGSSGSGKTTLINLIPRFYDPTGGRLTIDGYDLRSVTLTSLRRQLAMVTQETFLFAGSVRNNIAYEPGEPDMPRVIDAAQTANAHDFIMSFPRGYDTEIGELGVKISGGQRQRLAIARALYKNAPILVLDEATSSLDTEAEREVQDALDALMRGRTTFVIAHRLSTVRRADRILVLKDGRIVEEGRHDELMTAGGEYARLYSMQFREDG